MLVSFLLSLALLQILVFSLPIVANGLIHSLEKQYPPQDKLWEQMEQITLPQAIVVLGAGRNRNAIEYGGESTSLAGIERLRYAALLHRNTGLPILVSGGKPLPDVRSEASLMAEILREEFQVPVKWLEESSHTTWQNAQFSDKILYQAGIRSAWLVTQAWHMPRSLMVFRGREVKYQPASTSFGAMIPWSDLHMKWVPQPTALARSMVALHEWLGILWYRLRAYLS